MLPTVMASNFEYTVKVPSKFHKPYMSYTEMMQCLYDQLLPNDVNEDFFKTLILALQWETKQLEFKQIITS